MAGYPASEWWILGLSLVAVGFLLLGVAGGWLATVRPGQAAAPWCVEAPRDPRCQW